MGWKSLHQLGNGLHGEFIVCFGQRPGHQSQRNLDFIKMQKWLTRSSGRTAKLDFLLTLLLNNNFERIFWPPRLCYALISNNNRVHRREALHIFRSVVEHQIFVVPPFPSDIFSERCHVSSIFCNFHTPSFVLQSPTRMVNQNDHVVFFVISRGFWEERQVSKLSFTDFFPTCLRGFNRKISPCTSSTGTILSAVALLIAQQ